MNRKLYVNLEKKGLRRLFFSAELKEFQFAIST